MHVCVCVSVCALTLRAPGTSCPLTASPTVGRASAIGPEQCQKKKKEKKKEAVIKTNHHALFNTEKRRAGACFPLAAHFICIIIHTHTPNLRHPLHEPVFLFFFTVISQTFAYTAPESMHKNNKKQELNMQTPCKVHIHTQQCRD